MQADLEIPIILYQRGQTLDGIRSPDRAGLSAPLLSARVGLTSQKKGGLLASEFPVDIAFQLAAAVPVTSGNALGNEFAMAPQLSVGHDFGNFRLGGELFSWIRPDQRRAHHRRHDRARLGRPPAGAAAGGHDQDQGPRRPRALRQLRLPARQRPDAGGHRDPRRGARAGVAARGLLPSVAPASAACPGTPPTA
jgi:hypothetical protein